MEKEPTPLIEDEKVCKVCGNEIDKNGHDGYCCDECYIEDTRIMIEAMASLGRALTERMKQK